MTRITKITGTAILLKGNDIDTDRIIPARFLKEITFKNMGEYVFYDERFDEKGKKKVHPFNDKRYSGASILIVNKNFGCGSSREHAPQAIMRYGIKAIIGESFGEIFSSNCMMLGIPVLVGDQKTVSEIQAFIEQTPKEKLEIDITDTAVSYKNKKVKLNMNESYRNILLNGTWDMAMLMLENNSEIEKTKNKIPYLNHYNKITK
jgi:3-isopropylmalate/(R)-2-methylmalate dehydratase small subunit